MVKCPHCQTSLSIPESLGGQAVSCPTCNQTFTAPAYAPAPAPSAPDISIQTAPSPGPSSSGGSRYQRSKKDSSGLIVGLLIANLIFTLITASLAMLNEYRIQEVRRGFEDAAEELRRDFQSDQ